MKKPVYKHTQVAPKFIHASEQLAKQFAPFFREARKSWADLKDDWACFPALPPDIYHIKPTQLISTQYKFFSHTLCLIAILHASCLVHIAGSQLSGNLLLTSWLEARISLRVSYCDLEGGRGRMWTTLAKEDLNFCHLKLLLSSLNPLLWGLIFPWNATFSKWDHLWHW